MLHTVENGFLEATKPNSTLTDEMVNQVLARYRRQRFVQSMIGPCISFSLHAVMFVTAVAMVFLPPQPEASFTITCIEVPECTFDDEYVIEEIIEEERELIDSLDILVTTNPQNMSDSSEQFEDMDSNSVTEPSDSAPQEADCESTDSPLIYYSNDSTVATQSGGAHGGTMVCRTTCGCGICKRLRTYGTPDSVRGQQCALRPALNWLARVQNPNGSWGSENGWSSDAGHPAHTGLALLVFLAQGETPVSPLYGPTVQKALSWLSTYAMQENLTEITHKRHGAYSHGIATYALAEAYGVTQIPFLATAMENCVDVLIDGQMVNGGFGYSYTSGPRWDMSVTGWNIQAMKAAQLAGCQSLKLQPAMARSLTFLKQIAYTNGGRFGYAGTSTAPRPNMAGVGVLCLQLLEDSPSTESMNGYSHIVETRLKEYQDVVAAPEKWNNVAGKSLYGWYYDTQAVFNNQMNRASKKTWGQWRDAFEKALIRAQNAEGYWETDGTHTIGTSTTDGRVLATCLCALQLEVYYRRLPTYSVKKHFEKHSNKDQGAMAAVADDVLIID